MKIHFEACLRLAKLFKLEKLLDEFSTKLYFLDRRVVKRKIAENTDTRSGASGNREGEEEEEEEYEELRMSQFDVNAPKRSANGEDGDEASTQLTINETDIFCM